MANGRGFREKLVLAAFGLSGGAALIYEVVWTKVLSLVLGGTVFAISTMLSSFLGGLALGAYIGGRRADGLKEPVFSLGVIELGIGVFGILTLLMIGYIQPLYAFMFMTFNISFSAFSFAQFLLCFLIMIVPTTLMGLTFPVVCKAVIKGTDEVGRDTGYVYAVNTVGAIVGSMSAGFLLIPLLGLKGANMAAVSINLLSSTILLVHSKAWQKGRIIMVVVAAFLVLTAATPFLYANEFVYPLNYYMAGRYKDIGREARGFPLYYKGEDKTLLFKSENAYGVVQVFKSIATKNLSLVNNGKIEGGSGSDRNTQLLLALLPHTMKPNANSFLNIGLGTGMTLNTALEAGVEDVVCIEINPAVIEATRRHFYPGIFEDPKRPRLIVTDARNYLALSNMRYDIISSEPSYPTDDSVSHLFTKEFFELVRSRLNEDGVFCQWIPFHILGNRGTTVMLKTFQEVFPNSYFWNVRPLPTSGGADILMIGRNSDYYESYESIKGRLRADLLEGGAGALAPAMTDAQVKKMKGNKRIPINSDDWPILEFMAAKNVVIN